MAGTFLRTQGVQQLRVDALQVGLGLGGGGLHPGDLHGVQARGLGLGKEGQLAGEALALFGEARLVAGAQFGVDLAAQATGDGGFQREGVLAGRAVDGVFRFHVVMVVFSGVLAADEG